MNFPAAYDNVQNNVNIMNRPAVNEYGNWAGPSYHGQQGNYELYGNPMEFHGGAQPSGFGQVDQFPSSDSEYLNFSPFG